MLLASRLEAAEVANPGPVGFTFDNGTLTIGNESFNIGSPSEPAVATGTATADGALTIDSAQFPERTAFGATVRFVVIGTPTGHIDPISGAMDLIPTIQANIEGEGIPPGCHVGPIAIASITGRTDPPPPNTPISGSPYDTTSGELTLVDNSFAVPASSDCGSTSSAIDGVYGLPSPGGRNSAVLGGRSTPVLRGPEPVIGAAVNASAVSGTVRIDTGGGFRELEEGEQIPVGSRVDTRKGRIELVSATKGGATQSGEFYDGLFKLGQTKSGEVTLKLITKCGSKGRAGGRQTLGKKGGNKLWGDAGGKHKTQGHGGSATIRGTIWLTEDRCDGTTLVKVSEGSVSTRDSATGKRKTITAGKSVVLGRKR